MCTFFLKDSTNVGVENTGNQGFRSLQEMILIGSLKKLPQDQIKNFDTDQRNNDPFQFAAFAV